MNTSSSGGGGDGELPRGEWLDGELLPLSEVSVALPTRSLEGSRNSISSCRDAIVAARKAALVVKW